MTKLKGTCYFCGKRGEVTKDHIPPRGIYPQEIRDQYKPITVRCHLVCEKPYRGGDQYLQIVLTSLTDKTVDHPVAQERREGVKRSLEMPELDRLWSGIAHSMKLVWRKTEGGIWIPRYRLELDYEKLTNVFSRFVRGLFHREKNFRTALGKDYEYRLLVPDDYGDEQKDEIYRNLGFVKAQPPNVKHDDVFEYRSVYSDDEITYPHSIWHFRFYNAHDFFVIVYSPSYKGPEEKRRIIT